MTTDDRRFSTRIALLPNLQGLGGPASFAAKLAQGLAARGVGVTFDPDDPSTAALLVIGGTRDLAAVRRAKNRGLRIVQRLNGMNWIHRQRNTGVRHYLRSEANNALLSFIRRNLAARIVYQSHFSQNWWERVYGVPDKPVSVVYNGVDLVAYTPEGENDLPSDHLRLLLVEGHLGGGNEPGLENAAALVEDLQSRHRLPVRLAVAGDAPAALRAQFAHRAGGVDWLGIVPRERIPVLDRSAHIFFSADLNAACPNSVVEALACGLPVIAFDTGALGEMVANGAGVVAPYGSDYWKLEPPVIAPLTDAAAQILHDLPTYRRSARAQAEAHFGLDTMVEGYLTALLG